MVSTVNHNARISLFGRSPFQWLQQSFIIAGKQILYFTKTKGPKSRLNSRHARTSSALLEEHARPKLKKQLSRRLKNDESAARWRL